MKTNEITKEIKDLQEQIKNKITDLQSLFKDGLKDLLAANPDIDNISCYINNHEFNDGDSTYFSFSYEEPVLTLKDGTEYDNYDDIPNKEHDKVRKEFVTFCKQFDVDGFYESLFGEQYESIGFSLDKGKLSY